MWGSCKACGAIVCCNVVAASVPLIGIVREGSMKALCRAMAAAIEDVAEPLLFDIEELVVDAAGEDDDDNENGDALLVVEVAATMVWAFEELSALGAAAVFPCCVVNLVSDDIDNVGVEPHPILAFLLLMLFVGLDVGGGII